ncbi:MAG: hypothetical protein B0W54_19385 [Cellvibrio sp. 79]|nr:MAG: hypothetical protein B0W54_19385 [Cellvibrio sp. 79]
MGLLHLYYLKQVLTRERWLENFIAGVAGSANSLHGVIFIIKKFFKYDDLWQLPGGSLKVRRPP